MKNVTSLTFAPQVGLNTGTLAGSGPVFTLPGGNNCVSISLVAEMRDGAGQVVKDAGGRAINQCRVDYSGVFVRN